MSAQWFGNSAAFCSSHLRIVAMLHLNRIPSQAMHLRQVTKQNFAWQGEWITKCCAQNDATVRKSAVSIDDADDSGERLEVSPINAVSTENRHHRNQAFSLNALRFSFQVSPSEATRHTARRLRNSSVLICVHLWSPLRLHSPNSTQEQMRDSKLSRS